MISFMMSVVTPKIVAISVAHGRPSRRHRSLAVLGGMRQMSGYLTRSSRQGACLLQRERLQADAANMERPGADLIKHYLDPRPAVGTGVTYPDYAGAAAIIAREARAGDGIVYPGTATSCSSPGQPPSCTTCTRSSATGPSHAWAVTPGLGRGQRR